MSRLVAELTRTIWLKKLANSAGRMLQRHAPWFYDNMFLPLKIHAKKSALKGFRGKSVSAAESRNYLWTPIMAEKETAEYLVTVIVPCYNHAAYLEERLDSIYGQSYKNIEVILLDDASTDESQEILSGYRERYPDKTRTFFNEENSSNVFAQWKKGLELAKGDIVWIAESDDYSDRSFLEKLLPAFRDESVMLAFCRSEFVQGGNTINTTEYYLKDINVFDWNKSFYVTANQLVEQAFSFMNVIPNTSGALVRRPVELSGELIELWKDTRLCGDWLFYLDVIKGGCVYYSHDTTNYYRVHEKSTSLDVQQQMRYYKEHETVSRYLERHYRLTDNVHVHHGKMLCNHYNAFCHGDSSEVFEQYFSLDRILDERKGRMPNVLMAVFSMSIGGGETFPIVLANELRHQGVPVTVVDFQMGEAMQGVRSMLRADIPYIPMENVGILPELVQKLGIDVIHSHHGTVDEAVSYAMGDMPPSVHHVITLHGMYEAKEPKYRASMIRQVFPTCDAFVYIAEKNLAPFSENGIENFERFHKIGNGLPYSKGRPIPRSELGIPETAFVLCLVSRAIPEKGWQVAVDAVISARERKGRDIHLLLVGSGEMYDRLKGHVPPYVHLMGFRANVRDFFATADVGLLPSEFEGESFPLVLIDCLYCERPMIATDIGEVRNQLKTPDGDMAGVLLSLRDGHVVLEELADAICDLADNLERYEEVKSRCRAAAEKFHMEHVAEQYMEVYRNTVNR